MAFTGRAVLVAGGAGTVGGGLVLELLQQGAKVFVSSRSADKFRELQDKAPKATRSNLSLVQADVTTEDGAKKIFDIVTKQDGGVQHVVSSIGSWWQGGNLVNQGLAEFNNQIKQLVTGHFLLFKNFAPYLEKTRGSTYTFVTGGGATHYLAPGTSLLTVGAAALRGVSLAARSEHKEGNLAVGEFFLECAVHPTPDKEFKDDYNTGNDLIGRTLAGVIKAKKRDVITVRNRKDAEALCQ